MYSVFTWNCFFTFNIEQVCRLSSDYCEKEWASLHFQLYPSLWKTTHIICHAMYFYYVIAQIFAIRFFCIFPYNCELKYMYKYFILSVTMRDCNWNWNNIQFVCWEKIIYRNFLLVLVWQWVFVSVNSKTTFHFVPRTKRRYEKLVSSRRKMNLPLVRVNGVVSIHYFIKRIWYVIWTSQHF